MLAPDGYGRIPGTAAVALATALDVQLGQAPGAGETVPGAIAQVRPEPVA